MSNSSLNFCIYKLAEVSDKIKIVSRTAKTAEGFETDFAGGGIAFSANCEGNVALEFEILGSVGTIGVMVNDDFENFKTIKINKIGLQKIIIAENLSRKNHYFEIIKLNAHYVNKIKFINIYIDGELNKKPLQKCLKLEFYGDSISCGVGALCPTTEMLKPAGFYDNAYMSYNVYCSRILNAEISTCALPGYGFLYGYDTGKTQNLYNYIDYALFDKSKEYNHTNFIADIVIFELGTNDVNFAKNSKTNINSKELKTAVQNYIDKVRSYNKKAKILILGDLGNNSFNYEDKTNGIFIKLEDVIKSIIKENNNVFFIEHLGMSLTGGGWHPKQSEAKEGGKILAEYIVDNLL